MQEIIYKAQYFAEIDAEQKANHKNLPQDPVAVGYHNGLTMAKAIATSLAAPAPTLVPEATWEFGEPDIFGASYVRCTNCGWQTDHVDPDLWQTYPGHRFCGSCGARMSSVQFQL